jgi:hypothetical protein
MPKDERDLLVQAKIGQPVPSEHALGADYKIVAEPLDGAQKVAWLGPYVPMKKLVALVIEDAQVHPLGMQIHAAIVAVLAVVESHHRLLGKSSSSLRTIPRLKLI